MIDKISLIGKLVYCHLNSVLSLPGTSFRAPLWGMFVDFTKLPQKIKGSIIIYLFDEVYWNYRLATVLRPQVASLARDFPRTIPWASCQIRKIAGCACAGNAGNDFPATDFKGNRKLATRHASRHVRNARAVIHVGIASPRRRGKRSRYSRRMRNPQFYLSGKRPI